MFRVCIPTSNMQEPQLLSSSPAPGPCICFCHCLPPSVSDSVSLRVPRQTATWGPRETMLPASQEGPCPQKPTVMTPLTSDGTDSGNGKIPSVWWTSCPVWVLRSSSWSRIPWESLILWHPPFRLPHCLVFIVLHTVTKSRTDDPQPVDTLPSFTGHKRFMELLRLVCVCVF